MKNVVAIFTLSSLRIQRQRGYHELRAGAPGYRTIAKRLPCEGHVVLDVELDEAP